MCIFFFFCVLFCWDLENYILNSLSAVLYMHLCNWKTFQVWFSKWIYSGRYERPRMIPIRFGPKIARMLLCQDKAYLNKHTIWFSQRCQGRRWISAQRERCVINNFTWTTMSAMLFWRYFLFGWFILFFFLLYRQCIRCLRLSNHSYSRS